MLTEQTTAYFGAQEAVCRKNDNIAPRLYEEYGVNKGLRDEKGNGVLAGIALASGEPKQISGKQELYEMIINQYI